MAVSGYRRERDVRKSAFALGLVGRSQVDRLSAARRRVELCGCGSPIKNSAVTSRRLTKPMDKSVGVVADSTRENTARMAGGPGRKSIALTAPFLPPRPRFCVL